MPHDRRSVTACAKDLSIAAAEVSGFEDGLAAAAARRAHRRARASYDRDPCDLLEAELKLRGAERALFGAGAEPIACVLHVRARDNLTVDGLDRAPDVEVGIRRI